MCLFILRTLGSKNVAMYQVKYMTKDAVDINASASVLIDAFKNIQEHKSTAEDSGEAARNAKHFAQAVANKVNCELDATQAAGVVLCMGSSYHTDSIDFHYSWDYFKVAQSLASGGFGISNAFDNNSGDDISGDAIDSDTPDDADGAGSQGAGMVLLPVISPSLSLYFSC